MYFCTINQTIGRQQLEKPHFFAPVRQHKNWKLSLKKTKYEPSFKHKALTLHCVMKVLRK